MEPKGSKEEMGQSFQALYAQRNQKIQRELEKADAKLDSAHVKVDEDGALIQEENPIASSSYSSEGELGSENT